MILSHHRLFVVDDGEFGAFDDLDAKAVFHAQLSANPNAKLDDSLGILAFYRY
jgi:hypothetical protein